MSPWRKWRTASTSWIASRTLRPGQSRAMMFQHGNWQITSVCPLRPWLRVLTWSRWVRVQNEDWTRSAASTYLLFVVYIIYAKDWFSYSLYEHTCLSIVVNTSFCMLKLVCGNALLELSVYYLLLLLSSSPSHDLLGKQRFTHSFPVIVYYIHLPHGTCLYSLLFFVFSPVALYSPSVGYS